MWGVERRLGASISLPLLAPLLLPTVSLTVSEAQAVATKLQDLVHIQVDRHHEKSSFTAGNFVGTATIWGGSAGLPAAKGEGMKAAIFDDALNPFHDSFADQGIVNPLGAGTYLGVCNPSSVLYNATSGCNSKVIGMYSFSKDRTVYPVMHDGQQVHPSRGKGIQGAPWQPGHTQGVQRAYTGQACRALFLPLFPLLTYFVRQYHFVCVCGPCSGVFK